MARRPRSRNKHIARSRSARGNRVDKKSNRRKKGIWQAIQDANHRAHQRSNHRTWRRKGLTSVKATLAGHQEHYALSNTQLVIRTLLGLLLLFPCFVSTVALFDISTLSSNHHNFWTQLVESKVFLYFSVGTFLMLGWFFSGIFKSFFLYLYVLGHELTHAFFIYLCGGKISGFKVTADGGYVVTNKSNILIALSPYFVPFWSIIFLSVSALVRLIWDIPYHDEAEYLIIGVTWTFHLAWTLWMIPRDQPDLKENGSFFSLTIIYLANVIILSVLLSLAPNGLSLKGYLYAWINLFNENITAIKAWVISWL